MKNRISFTVTADERAEIEAYVKSKRRWLGPAAFFRDAVYQLMARYPTPNSRRGAAVRTKGESSPRVLPDDFNHISPGGDGESFQERVEKSAFWYVLRKKVFERDKYKCQKCGGDGQGILHIHHIHKRSEGGKDTEDNLITLCPPCHARAEPHRKRSAQ